ncbi:cytochrome c-type biogenesis protein CcmH [Myxococcota bacterium]|nr:cytochrome c-type biogenesis protein CcmH [Myxococcota bacterium]
MSLKRYTVRLALLLGLALAGSRASAQADMETASHAPASDLVLKALGLDPNAAPQLTDEQIVLARTVGRDVVCLCGTCPKEPIADCQCGWASQNRRAIQGAIARGMSRDDIVKTYRQAYGDKVLAMLPNEGFARAAWILPYTAAVLGLFAVLFVGGRYLRKTRGHADGAAKDDAAPDVKGTDESKKALARELDELD